MKKFKKSGFINSFITDPAAEQGFQEFMKEAGILLSAFP